MNTADDRDRTIRVFLVDDHSMFRAGVRSELDTVGADRVQVVGESGTVSGAIDGIAESQPDVVLLDVHMPDGGGLAVLQAGLRASDGHSRYLCLSVSDSAEDVIALIRAGARGYVTKSISSEELIDAIRRIHTGDAVFSPRLAGYVLDAFSTGPAPAPRPDPVGGAGVGGSVGGAVGGASAGGVGAVGVRSGSFDGVDANADNEEHLLDELTRREREVLRLLARGYTYREMAEKLFISVKTVETHVSNILRKTQHTNRHSLSRWVTDHQL